MLLRRGGRDPVRTLRGLQQSAGSKGGLKRHQQSAGRFEQHQLEGRTCAPGATAVRSWCQCTPTAIGPGMMPLSQRQSRSFNTHLCMLVGYEAVYLVNAWLVVLGGGHSMLMAEQRSKWDNLVLLHMQCIWLARMQPAAAS